MFNYLIYMSKATSPMDEKGLGAMLDESRDWNTDHGITGMLLYVEGKFLNRDGGRFIQVLEGSAEEVTMIFEKIKMDKRHFDILILQQATLEKRSFEKWTMGFKSVRPTEFKKMKGFFDLNGRNLNILSLQKLNIPLSFLKSFYRMNAGV